MFHHFLAHPKCSILSHLYPKVNIKKKQKLILRLACVSRPPEVDASVHVGAHQSLSTIIQETSGGDDT